MKFKIFQNNFFYKYSLRNAFQAQGNDHQQPANGIHTNSTVVIQETIEEPVTPRIVIEETVIEDTSVPEQGGNSVTFKNLRQIHEQL